VLYRVQVRFLGLDKNLKKCYRFRGKGGDNLSKNSGLRPLSFGKEKRTE